MEKDDNGAPVHRLVLIKMITGLGLGKQVEHSSKSWAHTYKCAHVTSIHTLQVEL